MDDQLVLRPETPADAVAVDHVVDAAFRPAGAEGTPAEVGLVRALRADEAWLPALCFVALGVVTDADDAVIGQVTCSRGWVGEHPAVGLGPLAVAPTHQGRGVGLALMTTVLRLAREAGESAVILLGDPAYYRRFGFVPAADHGITPPVEEWAPHFQVAALNPPVPTGTFRYAAPFDDLT